MTIVVRDGRIGVVESNALVNPQENATVVDGSGRYLIPGLWDMHVHLSKTGETALPLFLANGITSVRDLGSDFREVSQWRAEIDAGQRVGPRIKTAGPYLESASNVRRMLRENVIEPVARTRIGIATPEDASRIVDSVAKLGVDLLKFRTFESKEVYFAIGAAARRAGLELAGHADRLTPDEIIKAGQRSIEHSRVLASQDDVRRLEEFRRLAAAGVVVVQTINVVLSSLLVPDTAAAAIVDDGTGRRDPRRKYIAERLLADWREQVPERSSEAVQEMRQLLPAGIKRVKEMHQAGMSFMPGSDVGVLLIYPGFGLHDELHAWVRVLSIPPMEALVSATREPARWFGMEDSLGTVEVGKLADLVLLEEDPLAGIENTKRIRAVVRRGRLFDRAALDRMLADVEAEVRR